MHLEFSGTDPGPAETSSQPQACGFVTQSSGSSWRLEVGSRFYPTSRNFCRSSTAGMPLGDAMCYTASMRPGRTKTTSFSLDDATLKNLKALASRRHKGNVSALLAEF